MYLREKVRASYEDFSIPQKLVESAQSNAIGVLPATAKARPPAEHHTPHPQQTFPSDGNPNGEHSLQLYSGKAAPRIHVENGRLQRRITEIIYEYADSPVFGERRACVNSGSYPGRFSYGLGTSPPPLQSAYHPPPPPPPPPLQKFHRLLYMNIQMPCRKNFTAGCSYKRDQL